MNDDADLVARVRRGDRQAFNDLYNRYADDVFSMCLLILGDPTVARAAAGTAFALVARTRLNPLSDPTRLRPWLLELARGSALAWSGSPQARSVPVPHGVSPEELLDGAIVPAPTSLRTGLQRTFDRAAVAAAAAANRRAAERAGSAGPAGSARGYEATVTPLPGAAIPGNAPAFGGAPAGAPPDPRVAFTASGGGNGAGVRAVGPEDAVTIVSPSTGLPAGQLDEQVTPPGDHPDDGSATGLPLLALDRALAGSNARGNGFSDFRARPTIAVAAALAVAVAGLTAVISWPTGRAELVADAGTGMVAITPTLPAGAGTLPTAAQPPVVPVDAPPSPTVAGAYTSRPATSRPTQIVREVDAPKPYTPPPSRPVPAPTPPATVQPPAPTPPPTSQPTTPATVVPTTPPAQTPTGPSSTTPPDGNAPTPTTVPPTTTHTTPTAPPTSDPSTPTTGAPTTAAPSSSPTSSDTNRFPFPLPWATNPVPV
ncbi:RNA polymerase subunit sigma [Frankia sp. CcI49]|uniref:RNA polymerase sigma factor n=1 Tax=unclassified Frankia TaxID=2632575 RepID=UPI0006CA082B|nr:MULTISPECIES: hypothetical protein [unclassified Frankia]KPM53187.1 RNA polymerase sigma factor [Frankia sp. R43]ONH57780.1 RNA polymerase subunit sigma [Frankia sp. CcI49]